MINQKSYEHIVDFIKKIYTGKKDIFLHEPVFRGNEKKYLNDCIDSTYVSSVGEYVDRFELELARFTAAKKAVVLVNGTSALHLALTVSGVKPGDEVLTQPLSFVATANAISYAGAFPLFVDVDKETFGLSPSKLEEFLATHAVLNNDNQAFNKKTGRRISACVPMHTFGFPLSIAKVVSVCQKWNITVIEDAAEALGSFYQQKHCGLFGKMGTLSFNGNKIITCGGGGAIITNDLELAMRAKHLSTTAKISHQWDFNHDEIGYNYRLPNTNAALGLAQLEQIDKFLVFKRHLASKYHDFFSNIGIDFLYADKVKNSNNEKISISERKPNYWLNAIMLESKKQRDEFLFYATNKGVMVRPVWTLLHKLKMYAQCQYLDLSNAQWLEERVVNIPSGVV